MELTYIPPQIGRNGEIDEEIEEIETEEDGEERNKIHN